MGSGEGSTMRNFIVLYRSPNTVRVIKSRKLRWTGHVKRMEGRSAFKILTGKSTVKRTLGRPRRRLDYNIRIDLKEMGINTRNWDDLAQDRGIIGESL